MSIFTLQKNVKNVVACTLKTVFLYFTPIESKIIVEGNLE